MIDWKGTTNVNESELDPKIRTLVKVLNEGGIETTLSCEGHGASGLCGGKPYISISFRSLIRHFFKIIRFMKMVPYHSVNLHLRIWPRYKDNVKGYVTTEDPKISQIEIMPILVITGPSTVDNTISAEIIARKVFLKDWK